MSRIKIMSESLSNKIAAGEVVEKCASVVKELIENSIDAGSTYIKVDLIDSGTKSIKVTDDGIGMDEEDALLCFEAHATSKLLNEDDLFNICTLGFRGEALPSIASVSIVNLKTSNGETGISYTLEGGILKSKEKGDLRRGTIIEVRDLFFNTPARLKYLNSLYSELSNVISVIDRAALSHTNIRFTLTNNDKVLLQTDGSNNLLKTINQIYGTDVARKMLKINTYNDDYIVDGYISMPEVNKSNRNHIITIVNGRVVKNSELNKVINDSYHKYKPDNRYPVVVLNIEVDPCLTDVNIHPSKQDIKFSNFEDLKEIVSKEIERVLDNNFLGVDASTHEVSLDNVIKKIEPVKEEPKYEEVKELVMDFSSSSENMIKEEENNYNFVEEESKEDVKPFPKLYIVGQVLGTYIVCHNEKGMYLIDQHAAAERFNYEKYKKAMANPTQETISMLFPMNIEYPKDEFLIIKNNLEFIRVLGVDIEEFGDSSFVIKAHPTWFKEGLEELFVRNVLEKIITMDKHFDLERFNDSISAMMACKASVKANTDLSMEEMQKIIDDLETCKNPYNCAHGRPTIIHYPIYEIEKLFKRVL
ncbi:MAG: DNA mismatch repair endonuclease MutL [Bacilli bacterium]|nr:DNA mismatch repair endonuclease MutL [Bacilli bacterium]